MGKFGATYIALLLCLALGAYLIYFHEPPPVEEEETTEAIWVYEFDAADIIRFRIEPDGVEMYRDEDGNWQIAADRPYRFDDSRVRMLTNLVTSLRSERLVVEDAHDLSVYGLDEPWQWLVVEATDNRKIVTEFGDEVPLGGTWYTRTAGSNDVYLVPEHIVAGLGWQLNDIRSRWVCGFEIEDIASFVVYEDGQEHVSIERESLRDWVMLSPVVMPTDAGEVEDYIRRFRFLQAREFINDEPTDEDLQQYGLLDPQFRFVVTMQDDTVVELMLGDRCDERAELLYAMSSDEPYVYLVEQERALLVTADKFLLKRLVPYDMRAIPYFEIEIGQANWASDGPRWVNTEDRRRFEMPDDLVEPHRSLVSRLSRLYLGGVAGVDQVDPVSVGGPYEAVRVVYEVEFVEGEQTITLVRDDDGRYHTHLDGYNVSVWLSSAVVDQLVDLAFDN